MVTYPASRGPRKEPTVGSNLAVLVIALAWTVFAFVAGVVNWPHGIEEAHIVSGDGCHGVVSIGTGHTTLSVSDEYRNCGRSGSWTVGNLVHVKDHRLVSGTTGMTVTATFFVVGGVVGLVAVAFAVRALRRSLRSRRATAS